DPGAAPIGTVALAIAGATRSVTEEGASDPASTAPVPAPVAPAPPPPPEPEGAFPAALQAAASAAARARWSAARVLMTRMLSKIARPVRPAASPDHCPRRDGRGSVRRALPLVHHRTRFFFFFLAKSPAQNGQPRPAV